MLINDVFQLFAVLGGLAGLLILPCLFLSYLLTNKKEWPDILLGACILGCSIQAVSGLVWSHSVGEKPFLEVLSFLFVCILFTFIALYFRPVQSEEKKGIGDCRKHIFLPVILFAALLVRSIHPLQTFVLGQSDGYTHLQYLHFIVKQGHLENVVYPSGYHWLLAMPVLVFQIDSFLVARFGGAFFGIILVLAIYVFLDRLFDRRSAIFGSFCAACFPGMILLMKTGVGSFANQVGLFLVPCLFYLYTQIFLGARRCPAVHFIFLAACLGFAASVPMMLVHVFIIFSVERFITLFRTRQNWLRKSILLVILCLPAVVLIGFHFSQAKTGERVQAAVVLMDYKGEMKTEREKTLTEVNRGEEEYTHNKAGPVKNIVESPYFRLLIDLFTVKRLGFSNLYINSMGLILLFLFICCLGFGLYHGCAGLLVLGIWGGVTAVQAGTGFLQFSSYQREGWSLLIATCCLSGVIAGWVYDRFSRNRVTSVGIALLMITSLWWTIQHPPQHRALHSSAEDFVIRSVRFFSRDRATVLADCINDNSSSLCEVALLFDKDLPLTVVTRRFVGWRKQGRIVPNVMSWPRLVQSVQVNADRERQLFAPDRQYLVLIDKKKTVQSGEAASAFAMVSPGQVSAALRQQKKLYRATSRIMEYISSLSKNEWQVRRERLSGNLTAFVVIPVKDIK